MALQQQTASNAPGRKAGGRSYSRTGDGPVHDFSDRNSPVRKAEEDLLRRVPPHSTEAEAGVLAGVFMRPGEVMDYLSDVLTASDFYTPAHATIFEAFLALHSAGHPIDIVTTAQHLKDHNRLEDAGGAVYLGQLSQAVVQGANAEHYASIVKNKALQRNLIETCSHIISNSYEVTDDISQLLDESEQALFSLSRRTSSGGFVPAMTLAMSVLEKLSSLQGKSDSLTGITTGFSQLNNLTAGLQPSDLIIVAARPSMGKTAFALCLALNAAIRGGATVAIFSLEMSKEQLMQRMLAIWAKVDLSKIRKPQQLRLDVEWPRLQQAADVVSKAPIFIDDTQMLSTIELRSRARRLKAKHNLGLIVVDYLQLMHTTKRTNSREEEISDISRSLKALAKELNVPVVALAQLNRKLEERKGDEKRPILSDLRESGAIEQDADVIMFVYREDVYKFRNPQERPVEGSAEIIIGKQRNGPVGVANLVYKSPYTSFEERAYGEFGGGDVPFSPPQG